MPKEIEKRPETFQKKIAYLRIDFSEIITLLETMGVNTETISATSNGAEFEGLDDIKSAPARFSGEPSLQVSIEVSEGLVAQANVQFKKTATIVSGGTYPYSKYNKENNDLAKRVYEELQPFSNQWDAWASKITSTSRFLSEFGIVAVAFIWILNYFEIVGSNYFELTSSASIWVFGIYFISVISDHVLKSRLPVMYNPRVTFWQKHGEAAIVGICTTLIASFVGWYFWQ